MGDCTPGPAVAFATSVRVVTTVELPEGIRSVALVHDFLVDLRGGERVFLELCRLFPDADLFSPVYDAKGTESRFEQRGVGVSFLNHLGPDARTFRSFLPLYPRAVESLELSSYDLILSSSSAWSHGAVARPGQWHLSYCHNPFRYAWDQRDEALGDRGRLSKKALAVIFERWRRWDREASSEVDRYVANGAITRERIARCFGRSSGLLHPPVDVGRFSPGTPGDSFVVLSELMVHKRIDVTVEACTRLGLPLVVIGDGPDAGRLRTIAGPSVEFTGRIPDPEVAERLSTARALIQCSTEEFGIATVEAQAAGRPVIALGVGGARETVVPGVTGELFELPDPETLARVLRGFDAGNYRPDDCRVQAVKFGPDAYAAGMTRELASMVAGPRAGRKRHSKRGRGLIPIRGGSVS